MKKKVILTSIVSMLVAMPAFAEFTAGQQIADENGLLNGMTCDEDTLGVTQDTANLEAIWTANTYSEAPGRYLLFENGAITQNVLCPAGSFCPGFTDISFADASIGIESCSTETNGEYPNSVAGTYEEGLCHTPSTITCATDNALTVSNGTVTYANTTTNGKIYAYGTVVVDNPTACAATVTCNSGYTATAKGALADYKYANALYSQDTVKYKSNDGENTMGNATGLSNGQWEVTYADGAKISGIASCNTDVGTPDDTVANGTYNTQSTGQYCWCNMTGYQFAGQNTVNTSTSSPWVFFYPLQYVDECAGFCVDICATFIARDSLYRGFLFGSLGDYPTCGANTISLNWYNEENTITPSNGAAEQCTYDGALTLPSNDMSNAKTGYTFGGWRVRETVQNNNNGNGQQ